jgi:hypothetical protein
LSETFQPPELLPIEPAERRVLSEEDKERPIWEVILERVDRIPVEELEPMPPDGSVNHDHYLYGAPRQEGR